MEIRFLGTGGVFDWQHGNSAALIRRRSETFLIDCGPTVYAKLCSTGTVDEIDHILLTHLHGDHVGSLSAVVLHMNLRASEKRRASILYPTEEFREDLIALLRFLVGEPELFV